MVWLFVGIFLVAAWFTLPCGPGSSWSARSRAAARTNELEAGKRRRIIGSGEGVLTGAGFEGLCGCSRAWLAEWSRKHPSGVGPCELGRRHDHVFGDRAAQSDDRARPVAGSCRESELARGWVTLLVGGFAVLQAWAAWAPASRWQARVSSLRAIAMVVIFFPRRWAMAV